MMGPEGIELLTSEAELAGYSYDAALDRGRPDAVAIPRTAGEVASLVKWCAETGTPFVARGAGTNLSGGCIPLRGGLVISLARLSRILEINVKEGYAVVEPGVVNLNLQKALEEQGYFYAPDPASFKVSTLGGNAAENAGGPRCLKYGTTTNHVLAIEAVMPDGSTAKLSQDDAGPELMSLLVGAEGTLGIITKLKVRVLPIPRTIVTMLAGFSSIESAVECVASIIAAGVTPRVLEAMDKTTVDSVEAYVHAGYPKTEAVLLIEADGDAEKEAAEIERLCRAAGCSDFRRAEDEAHRDKLWEGRRGAYAAMARLAPNVMVEDGVVPRDKLPEVVRRIRATCAKYGLKKAGLLFHAGDGNIHPNVGFDERDAEETARVRAAGHEILQACVELGGSLSGEHGIGLDKRDAMAWLFTPETLDLFRSLKRALDPKELANPDKLFPLAGQAKNDRPFRKPPSAPLSAEAERLVTQLRRGSPVQIQGTGSRLQGGEGELLVTAAMNMILDVDKANFTVTAEAGISVRELHLQLSRMGVYLRLPDTGGTLGGLLAAKPWPGLRDDITGLRLALSSGRVVELGGKVVKNVAGYDVPKLLLGSWGTLGLILDVTFKAYAAPQNVPAPAPAKPFALNPWQAKIKKAMDPENRLNPWLTRA
jgi:glycolate oxidase subunit GlcD